ncbi:DUF3322 domain-containing protein [Endozoicomonas sp. Mp262]|uniref:DUF3322 domain-containing protein n=1 Tax=Endozoicomonas sp. Mp262 TaxID=2919499 RepID=UPI0021DABB40
MNWGLTIETAIERLRQREWNRWDRLRDRLLGKRPLPVRVSLRAPTGEQALSNLSHFYDYIRQWREWKPAAQVQWQERHYHQIGRQRIPVALELHSLQDLFEALGQEATVKSKQWETLICRFLQVDSRLYETVIRNLPGLEKLPKSDIEPLANLLPQLKKNMGSGLYLRALPVKGVDTKFIENNEPLISDLLQVIHPDTPIRNARYGLSQWLGCKEKPKGWLIVRPLCPKTKRQMMGLSELKMTTNALKETPLPGTHIVVIENEQSGYSLPDLPNTVAVVGGGKNISWMSTSWLSSRHIGYWGDIDTWGLAILSDARNYQPHLRPLMMDWNTLNQFSDRMSYEENPVPTLPDNLTADEISLFNQLNKGQPQQNRLEQERLPQDYIEDSLLEWINQ